MNSLIYGSVLADVPTDSLTGWERVGETSRGHRVYVIEAEDGAVKIGISVNPRRRLQGLRCANGRDIARWAVTPPIMNAMSVEAESLDRCGRAMGEWVRASFQEAAAAVESCDWAFDGGQRSAIDQAPVVGSDERPRMTFEERCWQRVTQANAQVEAATAAVAAMEEAIQSIPDDIVQRAVATCGEAYRIGAQTAIDAVVAAVIAHTRGSGDPMLLPIIIRSTFASDFMRTHGAAMVAQHNASVSGQGVFEFPKKRRA